MVTANWQLLGLLTCTCSWHWGICCFAMFYSHRSLLPLSLSLSLSLPLSLSSLSVQIKPRRPRKRIKKFIMNLAADKSQEFGKKVDEFISEVKGQCNDPHQKMLSQVYQ